MNSDIQSHCTQIERCNQRGGRMLSVADLIEAGTMTREVAAYSLAAINAGASFMVGALPGGAGKTTVMGALLNFVPPESDLITTENARVIEHGLQDRTVRHCYVCHEIGPGHYHAYLWGTPLRSYFELPAAGHMIATNLHADTYMQTREQICGENRVPESGFRRANLLYFLAVTGMGRQARRRIAAIWEGDGKANHRLVFGPNAEAPESHSRLVDANRFKTAQKTIDAILARGARTITEVRTTLLEDYPHATPGHDYHPDQRPS